AGRFENDRVELALAPHQPVDDTHEIAAHRAADAAVVHLEHFFVGADDQVVIDADLAEFVDDDGVFAPVRLGEDAVEQGGLARAQITGEHGDGDLVGHRWTPWAPYISIVCPMPCGVTHGIQAMRGLRGRAIEIAIRRLYGAAGSGPAPRDGCG